MNQIDTLDQIVPASRGALRHQVMKLLLTRIFQGKLPAGTRLMIMKLAERFGISSTPCREALVELASIGVVEFIHHRGAVVAPFGPTELREIYQLRRILETEATRGACRRAGRTSLEALRQETTDLIEGNHGGTWSQRETASDQRLHELVAAECGNARLAREIRRYDFLVQTVREIIGHDAEAQQMAMTEHLAIIEAMLAGDPDRAAAAMARHIDSAAEVAQAAMFPRPRQ